MSERERDTMQRRRANGNGENTFQLILNIYHNQNIPVTELYFDCFPFVGF